MLSCKEYTVRGVNTKQGTVSPVEKIGGDHKGSYLRNSQGCRRLIIGNTYNFFVLAECMDLIPGDKVVIEKPINSVLNGSATYLTWEQLKEFVGNR